MGKHILKDVLRSDGNCDRCDDTECATINGKAYKFKEGEELKELDGKDCHDGGNFPHTDIMSSIAGTAELIASWRFAAMTVMTITLTVGMAMVIGKAYISIDPIVAKMHNYLDSKVAANLQINDLHNAAFER